MPPKTTSALIFAAGLAAGSMASNLVGSKSPSTPGARLSQCMRSAVDHRLGSGPVDAVRCSMETGVRDGRHVDLVLCKATRDGREVDIGALSDAEAACWREGGAR